MSPLPTDEAKAVLLLVCLSVTFFSFNTSFVVMDVGEA
jgi:hypothetical protein